MDLPGIGTNLATLREHLPLFLFLLFGMPALSFVSIKFWIAGRSSKVQRTTNWFVPTDFESDAARMHYEMQRQSVAFARPGYRNSRTAAATRDSSSRRSA